MDLGETLRGHHTRYIPDFCPEKVEFGDAPLPQRLIIRKSDIVGVFNPCFEL